MKKTKTKSKDKLPAAWQPKQQPLMKTARCWESHPKIPIHKGMFTGGACGYPQPDNNLYVGLDSHSMNVPIGLPWHIGNPISVNFPIQDMHAPDNPAEFVELIDWLIKEFKNGAKIQVGCIGGHGRTGTVLAALVAKAGISDDPIKWARENYCTSAVESKEQVDFLIKYFDCKEAEPTKSYHSYGFSGSYSTSKNLKEVTSGAPQNPAGSIWGRLMGWKN